MEGDSGSAKHPQQLFFDNVSPATRLLEKRRQMYEVQDALENQKVRFNKDEEHFRKKEEALRGKDLQLQAQLIKFNKFLQDNEAKRRRAEQRAIDENRAISEREEEIRKLEKDLDEATRIRQELDAEVTKNRQYEEFLDKVKETDDNYSEILDLVTRYDTLESAHRDLMKRQKEYEESIENLRNEYQIYRKEQEMKMLELNNKHVAKRTELEERQRKRSELEQDVDGATQESSKSNLRFGQILMSVENLFIRCTTKRKSKTLATLVENEEAAQGREGEADEEIDASIRAKKEEAIKHLKIIELYLMDFKEITETLKREKKADKSEKAKLQSRLGEEKPQEIHIEWEEGTPAGERASANSGSQGNTKEVHNSRPGVSAVVAS